MYVLMAQAVKMETRPIQFYDLIFPFMGLDRINCTKQYTAYTDGMSKVILIPTEEEYLEHGFHRN